MSFRWNTMVCKVGSSSAWVPFALLALSFIQCVLWGARKAVSQESEWPESEAWQIVKAPVFAC